MNERCESCRAFDHWGLTHGDPTLGRCRKHPPDVTGWPNVRSNADWCLEHEAKPAKRKKADTVTTTAEYSATPHD